MRFIVSKETKDFCRKAKSYPNLTLSEEMALGHRIAKGDCAAREQLFNANLAFAIGLAFGWSAAASQKSSGMDIDDVISVVAQGLWAATLRYNPRRELKFGTFAKPWCFKALLDDLDEHGYGIRLPRHVKELGRAMARVEIVLVQKLERQPTDSEIAAALGMPISIQRIAEVRQLLGLQSSLELDRPVITDDLETFGTLYLDPDAEDFIEDIYRSETDSLVRAAIARLPQKDQAILCGCYGIGRNRVTYRELTQEFEAAGWTPTTYQGIALALQRAETKLKTELEALGLNKEVI